MSLTRRTLQALKSDMIKSTARRMYTLRVIPNSTRLLTGHRDADYTLSTPPWQQTLLFRYRLGLFIHEYYCKCEDDSGTRRRMRRGHEQCSTLPYVYRLSKDERQQKRDMRTVLDLHEENKFTNVDYLLATRKHAKAYDILS